jgi:hypothetical protein
MSRTRSAAVVDRASARMITALAKQPAWVDSMTPELRERLVAQLAAQIPLCDSPRDIASITRALASLEKNDIDRTRLFLDAEKESGDEATQDELAAKLRAAVQEIEEHDAT